MEDTAVESPAEIQAAHPVTDQGATGDSKPPKMSASKTSKKTATTPKPRKPNTHIGDHPKYSVMIADAISHLKERGGSSRQAILKYIMNKYNVGKEVNMINARVKVALKAGVKIGTLKQSRGTGASGSFRLSDKGKQRLNSVDSKPKLSRLKKEKASASKVNIAKNAKKMATKKTKKVSTKSAKLSKSRTSKEKVQKKNSNTNKAKSSTKADKDKQKTASNKKKAAASKKPKTPKPKFVGPTPPPKKSSK